MYVCVYIYIYIFIYSSKGDYNILSADNAIRYVLNILKMV